MLPKGAKQFVEKSMGIFLLYPNKLQIGILYLDSRRFQMMRMALRHYLDTFKRDFSGAYTQT